jgi:hypothetical protein
MKAQITITQTMTCYDGPETVQVMRLQTLISGIKLEIRIPGMRVSRGVNCHKIAKQDYGCKGDRKACLEQLLEILALKLTQTVVVDETQGTPT